MDKSAIEAMEIYKMLNGTSPDEDAILEEAVKNEEKKPKQSKSTSKKKEVKLVDSKDKGLLPKCEFAKLEEKGQMTIFFKEHHIDYKEQKWPVPDRTVNYDILLVRTENEARRISDILHNNSEEDRKRAVKGLVRYYKIAAAENVNNDVSIVAYVEVVNTKNGPSFRIMTNNGVLKKYNASIDDVSYDIRREMLKIIKKYKTTA